MIQGVGTTELLEKTATQEKTEVREEAIDYVPIASQRFQDVLPLIPSAVRGPDGLINVKGARAAESSLLVNGSNVTDPVTGNFAIDLPIKGLRKARVIRKSTGFKIFNVLNRFGPRDVQNNIDSDRFGFLNNSLHQTYRIAFEVQYCCG